jgi:cytochrome c-type biogenesis protein CcmE
MSSKKSLLLGGAVVAACAVVMAVSLASTRVSAVKFAELAQKRQDERCEVYGELDAASIKSIKGATQVQFELVEEKTGQRLKVLYDNPSIALPPTFPAASHAKVNGTYNALDHQFVGDTVMTKCPTKYNEEVKLDIVRKDAMNKWQKAIGVKPEEKPSRAGAGSPDWKQLAALR